MSLELFREDRKKWKEGSPCWVNQMMFLICRSGTTEYKEQISEITERVCGLFYNPKDVDNDLIDAHWLAEYGVAGWEDVAYEENGKIIEFSREAARKLLMNEDYRLSLVRIFTAHSHVYEYYLYDKAYKDTEEIKKP